MDPFRTCSSCFHVWGKRDEFLSDRDVRLVGYQPIFQNLEAGLFLFNHVAPGCGTTLSIAAGAFADLYDGPIFQARLNGTDKCPQYCLREDCLEPCPEQCECAYVLEILQRVKNWTDRLG